jgi:AbrB family looped-hinge helix DNA binding protein
MNLEGFIGILATLPTVVNVLGIADIDKKGRMTVPVDVRKDLDIVGLTKVAFVKTREGDVIIKKAEKV